MTVEEYIRAYRKESPIEIVDGEINYLIPMVVGQGTVAQAIDRALSEWEAVGHVFFRLPYVLLNATQHIQDARLTEVQFIRTDRLEAYKKSTPDWLDLPMMISPDIAVNVLPFDGSIIETNPKFERYLTNGVQLVWVVDSNRKTVTVRGRD